jgi:hypothetical protein
MKSLKMNWVFQNIKIFFALARNELQFAQIVAQRALNVRTLKGRGVGGYVG